MGKPAARMGDMTAHGGTISAGLPTVLIGGMPAARATDMHVCPLLNPGTPPPPHVGGPIMLGSPTVLIGGLMAARLGDMATCAGPPDSIAMGCMTVLIGESASGGGGGGGGAGGGGSALSGGEGGGTGDADPVEATVSGGSPVEAAMTSAASSLAGQELGEDEDHFLDVKFVDKAGLPVRDANYKLTASDKREATGLLQGQARKTGVKPGSYEIDVRKITKAAWSCTEAREGDKIELLAEAVGFKEGAPARFRIYCRDISTSDKPFAEITDLKLEGGSAQAEWKYAHPDDMDLVDPADGDRYSAPQFYFKVDIEGETQRSGMLSYQDWVEIEVKDARGKGAADEEYILYLANGEIRRGQLDGSGKAKEENLAPGLCSMVFPNRENIEAVVADDELDDEP